MTTIKAFVARHPALSYFVLTFLFSWGGLLLLVGPDGFPVSLDEIARLMMFVYPVWVAGPAAAGLLLTAYLYGRDGLRDFGSRLVKWRVNWRWYAVALLTAPAVVAVVLLALSLVSPDYLPRIYTEADKLFLVQFSLISALFVAVFEELGWTGFAVPALRQRYGVFMTGLIVGIGWAAWRMLVIAWAGTGSAAAVPLVIFIPVTLFTWLPPYRVIMTWVYEHTGSMLVAMLMHTSLTTFWTMLTPLTIAGTTMVAYYVVLAVALWVVVGVGALVGRGQRSRGVVRGRVA